MANFVKEGFDRVMRAVVADGPIKTGLLTDFRAGNDGGNIREIERRFDARLSTVAWSWPWFDEWRHRFAESDRWPYMWQHYWQSRVAAQPEYLERQRRALLADTILRAVTQARELASGRSALRQLGAEDFRWSLHTGDGEFHDVYLPGIGPAIARGDLSRLPPFFPGDRSLVSLVPRE